MSDWISSVKHTVLGERGFIGSALMRHLTSAKLDCQSASPSEFISNQIETDILYYCIGLTSDFTKNTKRTLDSHVNLLLEVLQTRRFRRLVYLSSARVYMDSEKTSEDETIALSSRATDNIYLLSKLLGESLVLSSESTNCRIVRLSNVVGPHQPPTTLLGSFLENSRQGKLVISESRISGRDYVALDDVVSLIIQIGVHSQSQIYNISSNQFVSHSEIASYIRKYTGVDIFFSDNSKNPPRGNRVNNDKVRNEFGWKFQKIRPFLKNLIEGELQSNESL